MTIKWGGDGRPHRTDHPSRRLAVLLALAVIGFGVGGEPNHAGAATSDRGAEALRALGHSALRVPGSLPDPSRAAGRDTLPGIDHIVVLMMENHSFDNLFGMLGRGDGFVRDGRGQPVATNPYPDGRLQHAFHMPTTCQLPARPSNEWGASHHAYDGGANDGFVRTPISPANQQMVGGVAMGYWTGADVPFTYSLASAFPIADRWFASTLAQTDPQRRYLIAATSAGMTDDPGGIANLVPDLGLLVPALGGTIFNQLDAHAIGWANYVDSYPAGATPDLFPGNDLVTEAGHNRPFAQFSRDAATATLPAFSLLDPNYHTQSQENPQNMARGDALLAQVVTAIGSSRLWTHTVLVVTYDEGGGYYDHVPPPAAVAPDVLGPQVQPGEGVSDGFARYGFRVPAVVVSAYARPNYVSHVLHDHTSVLAMVERKWNLPALTYRDANANDLTDFLDLNALAAGHPTFPTLPRLAAAGDTPAALACSTTGAGVIPPPGSITP